MAVLVPKDWHPPREHHIMDGPSSTTTTTATASPQTQTASPPPQIPRARSSPANEHGPGSPQGGQPGSQPYPYGVPSAGWAPSPTAQPFYPQFYQNAPGPYPMHGHPGAPMPGQMAPPSPYYDPAANAQFAQWAYQQMMYNQAHQMQQGFPPPMNQMQGYNGPFPGPGSPGGQVPGTFGPPHMQGPGGQRNGPGAPSDYSGFHPYRRPNRQGSHSQDTSQPATPTSSTRQGSPVALPPNSTFQPPYARADATSSSSSVSSSSSNPRQRTESMKNVNDLRGTSGHAHQASNGSNPPRIRTSSLTGRDAPSPKDASSPSLPPAPGTPKAHHRSSSASSTPTVAPSSSRPSAASTTSTGSATGSVARPAKPSPLSQAGMTIAEKRMSRDDSDLAAMKDPGARGAGLKGRLRRAFTALQEEEDAAIAPLTKPISKDAKAAPPASPNGITRSVSTPVMGSPVPESDQGSLAMGQPKKKRALFNSKFNRSTDNISISSVSSSASVMIRKLGSIGKLARRNSIAGITSLFKDKKEKEDAAGEGSGKKEKKKKGKGEAAVASVSHITAELERPSGDEWTADMNGMSPAQRLARQHTLKTNAEAAARAKAQQEAQAAAAAAAAEPEKQVPGPWAKNTTNRQGGVHAPRVAENGAHDDDDEGSEDGTYRGDGTEYAADAWDDDHSWDQHEGEEEVTIRQDLGRVSLEEADEGYGMGEAGPWAVCIRRSVERGAIPTKGILKNAENYDQTQYLEPSMTLANRARSNSYNALPNTVSEVGPLADLPSPDPDHIDGLHRHGSHSSGGHAVPSAQSAGSAFLPSFSFESGTSTANAADPPIEAPHPEHASPRLSEKSLFNHPNSSAPALTTLSAAPVPITHRSATAPAKKLSFASNLSVYDTFPPTAYDRRSEPATWSRLTPALAQRIKEELNSYKMEEMEVHVASRRHTQFFV